MDVLDEKQNGAPPPMEVDEVVSVRDRKFFRFFVELEADFSISRWSFRFQTYAGFRSRRKGFHSIYMAIEQLEKAGKEID